jgi:hypothetical protein
MNLEDSLSIEALLSMYTSLNSIDILMVNSITMECINLIMVLNTFIKHYFFRCNLIISERNDINILEDIELKNMLLELLNKRRYDLCLDLTIYPFSFLNVILLTNDVIISIMKQLLFPEMLCFITNININI